MYDEMLNKSGKKSNDVYRKLYSWLYDQNSSVLLKQSNKAEELFRKVGITFNVYEDDKAEERLIPFDLIPRIIEKKEWDFVKKGIAQRLKALNLFLKDIYFDQKIIKDGVIPSKLINNNSAFKPQMCGFDPPGGIYIHVSGVDLIRTSKKNFYVLEDNLRVPSGSSYMIENRSTMMHMFPELFTKYNVKNVYDYPDLLLKSLKKCSGNLSHTANLAVLTPGIYNSAYFEHSYLAEQMGIALVEGKDLFVENDIVYMKTVKGPLRVDCIYRRLDDSFLDPKAFNKESVIGVPGLFKSWRKGNVGILNAIGTGIADDKVVYSYVNKMIVYYLGEQPILNQVETYLCHEKIQRDYVIENISKLVVKPANASGGYGIMIGPKAPLKEREEVINKIKKNPREFIAQPLEILSTAPTITENDIEPRHLDLRPFVLSGKTSYVTTGGLTRVALRKGSTIVNSSQGGGSKDTLIVDM